MVMRSGKSRRQSRGYALLWVLVMVAILAALAASASPYLRTGVDVTRYDTMRSILAQIGQGLVNFETAVQDGQSKSVHNYPGAFSQLSNPITTGNHNTCNTAMTIAVPNKGNTSDSITWIAVGPFVSFTIPTNGLVTPLGRMRDSIPYRGTVGGTLPIYMEIPAVTGEDANGFDTYIDAGVGDTVTLVHPLVNDTTTLRIRLLISGLGLVSNIC
jgi:type II secretory pathway pseudopilin PulG